MKGSRSLKKQYANFLVLESISAINKMQKDFVDQCNVILWVESIDPVVSIDKMTEKFSLIKKISNDVILVCEDIEGLSWKDELNIEWWIKILKEFLLLLSEHTNWNKFCDYLEDKM